MRSKQYEGISGLGAVVAAAILLGTTGCVATADTTASRGVVVSGPPPAPLAESRPAAPGATSAWVPGYWHWTGMQYAWIPGHWDAGGGRGSTWVGPRYFQQGGQYRYEAGSWARGNALR